MSEIWKFPVLPAGLIMVPAESEICHVGRDPATGLIAFWAIVDPTKRLVERRFEIVGTGQALPDSAHYHGTQIFGELVWHLLEIQR